MPKPGKRHVAHNVINIASPELPRLEGIAEVEPKRSSSFYRSM